MRDNASKGMNESFHLIEYLWDRRKLLLGITALGALVGLIAAFTIQEKYKSEVILFPAMSNSASKSLLSEISTGRDDILALGDEEDAEQLLQILHSDDIRDQVVDEFNLEQAYDIKPDAKYRRTLMREAYKDHIKFEYTKFGSVRVEVLHPDKDTCALIANHIALLVDTVWDNMAKSRARKGLELVQRKVNALERSISSMDDSLRVLRKFGVHDYHTQTERYNEYLGAAIVKGDQRAINEFEKRFDVLAEYGGAYVTIQDRVYNETKRLSVLKMKLEQAQADMESDLPHKFIVNKAQPADKKAYPVRWLIMVVSTASAFILALLLIIVKENINVIRKANG